MTQHHVPPRGPLDAPIVILGEAPGVSEEAFGKPFIGKSGQELTLMLREASLDPNSFLYTNVFPIRPEGNKVEHFFTTKKEGVPGLPPLTSTGKYLKPEHLPHLLDLHQLLLAHPRRLILALGNTALWAVTGRTGIGALRGVFTTTTPELGSIPVLPTYHPAHVLRSFALRSVAVADLCKGADFLSGTIQAPSKSELKLHINPTPNDLDFYHSLVFDDPVLELGVDVETEANQIRTFGVAVSTSEAFVIPFFDTKSGVTNYWADPKDELKAWHLVIDICTSPIRKVFQNGLYDMQRALTPYGIAMRGVGRDAGDDIMLMHHALQPEMPKALDFLASIYLNTEAWKAEYRKGTHEQGKKDE